jgi:hypothetical protein
MIHLQGVYIVLNWNWHSHVSEADSSSVEKYHEFYRTRQFITVFTTARNLSLSWARSIQTLSTHPISLTDILTLPSYLGPNLQSVFPPGVCTNTPDAVFLLCSCHEISQSAFITRITFGQQYNPAAPQCTIFPVTVISDTSSPIKCRHSRSKWLVRREVGTAAVNPPRQWCRVGKSHRQIMRPLTYVFRPNIHQTMSAQRSTAVSSLLTVQASYEPNK